MLLQALCERVRSGWELPGVIRMQCVAAAKAAGTERLPQAAGGGAGGGSALAAGSSLLLAEAASAGIELPAALRSLQVSASATAALTQAPPPLALAAADLIGTGGDGAAAGATASDRPSGVARLRQNTRRVRVCFRKKAASKRTRSPEARMCAGNSH